MRHQINIALEVVHVYITKDVYLWSYEPSLCQVDLTNHIYEMIGNTFEVVTCDHRKDLTPTIIDHLENMYFMYNNDFKCTSCTSTIFSNRGIWIAIRVYANSHDHYIISRKKMVATYYGHSMYHKWFENIIVLLCTSCDEENICD